MAGKGKKIIWLDIEDMDLIDQVTQFIIKKHKGTQYEINFDHKSKSLKIQLIGPEDLITLLKKEILLFVDEILEEI